MTLPLMTSARTFFVAYLRNGKFSDEHIEAVIDPLAEEEGLFLMLQGGAAGIAQLQDTDASEPYVLSFGSCDQLGEMATLAFDVYGFDRRFEEELLC